MGARPRVAIRSESPLPGVADAVREVVRATVADAFHDGAASVEVDDRSVGGTLLGASAAGIAVMFALFSCSSLALRGLADEGAGFGDRLRSLRIGRLRRVSARMLALGLIAGVQLAWTFAFAAAVFGILPASPAALVAAVVASASAIASTVVALAALCGTRARFAAVSPVVTLVLSGLGGSMVPLVLMPPAIAWPSRVLFSAWAIEACSAGLRAGSSVPALALLAAWTAAMLVVASATEPESQP
jgi:ABC-2 type transport system permease protein